MVQSMFGGFHLSTLLMEGRITDLLSWDDAVAIKEQHCYVRARGAQRGKVCVDLEAWTEESHRSKEGKRLKVPGSVRTAIPEALFTADGDPFGAVAAQREWNESHFKPEECKFQGPHSMVLEAAKTCAGGYFGNQLPHMCESIVLSGGCTLFPGFAARLRVELIDERKRTGHTQGTVNLVGVSDRSTMGKYQDGPSNAFRGALAIAEQLGTREGAPWVPKEEFVANGPRTLAQCGQGKVQGKLIGRLVA
jgi:hypothetical protein